ncbi:MAG: VOC family protein [Hyphomonas sp.]
MAIVTTGMTPLIQVYDMAEALRFYRDILGFEVVACSPEVETPEGRFSHWMWLRLGPADLMLNTAYDAGERPPQRVSSQQDFHRDVCLYFGCDDIDAVFHVLSQRLKGLDPPQTAPYGMRQLYLQDPDGYGICFQVPA